MSKHLHHYQIELIWTGNRGEGTASYSGYGRGYDVKGTGGKLLKGSADPQFLGDSLCWNPEEMLLASLSACHQLWYLHLCADAGVRVLRYVDTPRGVMSELSGKFTEATLEPQVVIAAESDAELAVELHHLAHEKCYIANSMSFPVQLALNDCITKSEIVQ